MRVRLGSSGPGSSPHARGTLHREIHAVVFRAVHPRMRGEHQRAKDAAQDLGGSSPHARGTPGLGRWQICGVRFIPACAGNTIRVATNARQSAVHPRMRGEHRSRNVTHQPPLGSSPHARGTLSVSNHLCALGRFIPACAGNTSPTPITRAGLPVHPRMRGEHDRVHDGGVCCWRFIPACAGNTRLRCSVGLDIAVHPRMRGEHPDSQTRVVVVGSSPHARGTPRGARNQQ